MVRREDSVSHSVREGESTPRPPHRPVEDASPSARPNVEGRPRPHFGPSSVSVHGELAEVQVDGHLPRGEGGTGFPECRPDHGRNGRVPVAAYRFLLFDFRLPLLFDGLDPRYLSLLLDRMFRTVT